MTPEGSSYEAFLRSKIRLAASHGRVAEGEIVVHPFLKRHQPDCVRWMVRGGRRALFASFGLGKTVMQIEACRIIREREGGMALIVAPLGVRREFIDQGREHLGIEIRFIRSIAETSGSGIYITNYETIRDGKLDPSAFVVTTLDEADILRGFGGTKTFREFMRLFDAVPYRFVATATPSPNEYIELLAYAAYLGVMDVGEAKTRFFKRDSTKADRLTLHAHKEREFWLWVASWGLFVQRPSDLGHSDEGYELPAIDVRWHEVPSVMRAGEADKGGQMMMFRDAALGLTQAAHEKRDTLDLRVAKAAAVCAEEPDEHWILWHDLEDERRAIQAALPKAVSVWGSQPLEDREERIAGFAAGRVKVLSTKPILAGAGCNFQRHCARAVYVGIGFKFRDFIQSVHRIHRFLQARPVVIHIIHSEAEREVARSLKRKWAQHEELTANMRAIIREYGLSEQAMAKALERSLGCERIEVSADSYRLINNDCVVETRGMPDDSVGLIVSSIPFGTQYEYSPSYNDFGHTDDDAHFWAQMDFLIPELLRVLKPGRLCAIHVKDRVVPGGMTGLGFPTVSTFHADCMVRFKTHGFAFMGMKTITTDVVRENNQTYRLGWSEQCKDGSKMGFGLPEYLLLFRKPQTGRDNGYADEKVVKDKSIWIEPGVARFHEVADREVPASNDGFWLNPDGYSRAMWQMDAAGYTRSSGNRPVMPDEMLAAVSDPRIGEGAKRAYRAWKAFNLQSVYDFEHHVRIAEHFESVGRLPSTFALLPVHSPHPDVWTDITRMRTMNTLQAQKGQEQHLCPLQFDIVNRAIRQWSMPGEVIYDPFGGLMTVPYCAVKLGRIGWGCELKPEFFLDGCAYVKGAVEKAAPPSLFDVIGFEAGENTRTLDDAAFIDETLGQAA